MNKIFALLMFLGVLSFSETSRAQVTDFPDLSRLKSFSDYRKSEPKLREAIKWISKKESASNKSMRAQHIRFIDDYVEKSPFLKYTPAKSLVKFSKSSEYNLQFKIGWLQYILSYEYSQNRFENHYHAFEYLLSFYETNRKSFGRNSYLEKVKKLKQKGELKKFIQSKI